MNRMYTLISLHISTFHFCMVIQVLWTEADVEMQFVASLAAQSEGRKLHFHHEKIRFGSLNIRRDPAPSFRCKLLNEMASNFTSLYHGLLKIKRHQRNIISSLF